MAGIYIHIPFCETKCNYCNFYALATSKYRKEIIEAIAIELKQRNNYLGTGVVKTIYWGGGTPSILDANDIYDIFNVLAKQYQIDADAEITLEANPQHLSASKLNELKKTGINRLSIGIQSFNDVDLLFLGRNHTSKQAHKCIENAINAGFYNLNIDLIYGIPTLNLNNWGHNLKQVFLYNIPHLSAYSLTVEDKTPLAIGIRKGLIKNVEDELALRHYEILISEATQNAYQHYEISNYCKPDMYARHNTAYWQGKHYLGVGPSAHSYNGNSRRRNVANLENYIKTTRQGKTEAEQEILSETTKFNEYIMTSLRTMWGCNLHYIKNNFGEILSEKLWQQAQIFIQNKDMIYNGNALILTAQGKLFADKISGELFEV